MDRTAVMAQQDPVHILSLGAGVQSSTMALMAAAGEITPMPVAAIFADTQAEPRKVYEWLDWLEKQLPYPVIRATKGSLTEMSLKVRTSASGKTYTKHAVPAFIKDDAGKQGLLMRQCTADFKLEVIHRAGRLLLKEGRCKSAVMWIGISADEVIRIKPSRKKYLVNRWPLVDLGVTRSKCLLWMSQRGYPKPPRSACKYCPYHSDVEWRLQKLEEPEEFAESVSYDEGLRAVMAQVSGFRGTAFLHRSMKPLSEVDFDGSADGHVGDLFGNECEGMCGV